GRLHGGNARRRDDGGGCRRGGEGAARSDGDASLLRLPHGRLLPALDQDAARAEGDAEGLSRELVPQGCQRPLPLGRLRAEPARPEVDCEPGQRPRARARDTDRLDAALRGHRLVRLRVPARDVRATAGRRPARLAPRSDRARGTLHRPARSPAQGNDLRAGTADLPALTSRQISKYEERSSYFVLQTSYFPRLVRSVGLRHSVPAVGHREAAVFAG